MKKTLLFGIVSLLWLSIPVKAQLEKGTKYLGGTVNLTGVHGKSSVSTTTKSNQVNISPEIQLGKFIKDNRLVGLGVGANLNLIWFKDNSNTDDYKNKTNYNQFFLSPYIRHYKSLNSKFAIFLNSSVDLSYLSIKSQTDFLSSSENGYGIALNIVPGISYWITPRFALESDINLLNLGVGYQDFLNTKTVSFNSAVTSSIPSYFSVRASWYLSKK
ncbi:hypothetical protein L0657_02945 [Dyadobacter sp. CY345]|uniref:outer membrane beta-barrel protein n=1 Tax=Dyadobacter sp. CY345 TaxID=2909335 RepID=UPI001F44B6D1|nr:outer membrane beta-barrel protein [Dyadobacter sp. CY345]MCF2442900.1 hypothetical protein [Dyadobacter sp. CY345]